MMNMEQLGYFLYMEQCEKQQQEKQQQEENNENGSQNIGLERERTTTNQK